MKVFCDYTLPRDRHPFFDRVEVMKAKSLNGLLGSSPKILKAGDIFFLAWPMNKHHFRLATEAGHGLILLSGSAARVTEPLCYLVDDPSNKKVLVETKDYWFRLLPAPRPSLSSLVSSLLA